VTKFTPFDTRTFSPQDRSLGNGGGILIPGRTSSSPATSAA